jgi:hypothetical protein
VTLLTVIEFAERINRLVHARTLVARLQNDPHPKALRLIFTAARTLLLEVNVCP